MGQVGSTMVATAKLVYCDGVAPPDADKIVSQWNDIVSKHNLPISAKFSMVDKTLSDTTRLDLSRFGTHDAAEIEENIARMEICRRAVVMIDPHNIAADLILKRFAQEHVRSVEYGSSSMSHMIETAMSDGTALIITGLSEP